MLGMKKEDNARHSNKRTAAFFRGVNVVSGVTGVEFFNLDVEEQKAFLNEHFKAIVEACVELCGEEYAQFLDFRVFIVESKGNAVLYFEKNK
jgi:hypothetical protein